jgi:hypothetical protein
MAPAMRFQFCQRTPAMKTAFRHRFYAENRTFWLYRFAGLTTLANLPRNDGSTAWFCHYRETWLRDAVIFGARGLVLQLPAGKSFKLLLASLVPLVCFLRLVLRSRLLLRVVATTG